MSPINVLKEVIMNCKVHAINLKEETHNSWKKRMHLFWQKKLGSTKINNIGSPNTICGFDLFQKKLSKWSRTFTFTANELNEEKIKFYLELRIFNIDLVEKKAYSTHSLISNNSFYSKPENWICRRRNYIPRSSWLLRKWIIKSKYI